MHDQVHFRGVSKRVEFDLMKPTPRDARATISAGTEPTPGQVRLHKTDDRTPCVLHPFSKAFQRAGTPPTHRQLRVPPAHSTDQIKPMQFPIQPRGTCAYTQQHAGENRATQPTLACQTRARRGKKGETAQGSATKRLLAQQPAARHCGAATRPRPSAARGGRGAGRPPRGVAPTPPPSPPHTAPPSAAAFDVAVAPLRPRAVIVLARPARPAAGVGVGPVGPAVVRAAGEAAKDLGVAVFPPGALAAGAAGAPALALVIMR